MKKELKNNETCRYVCAARSNLQVMERLGITLREKFYRFMQGRYGSDQFNRFLMILALVCFVVSLFGAGIFYVIGIGILVYAYFRMLSKNVYKRREENNVYMRYEYRVRQRFASWKRDMSQRRTHHIYKCPSCRQKIRIPRGKGKIEIRCPKCGRTFIKRS
jgi:predicted RNA-binding Zn-ribbon protein involved in translation (DUF1610 family)